MTRDDQINKAIAAIPTIGSKVGIFVARDGVKAQVNIGPTTVSLRFAGLYLPPAGHPVRIDLQNGELVVTGPARPLPGVGKITVAGSPRATVSTWGADGAATTYMLPYRSTYTPTVNDDVEIAWSADTGVIQGKLSTTVTPTAPPTAGAGGAQQYHPGPFTAIDSGSYNGSWTQRDVWASNSYSGAWFYGSKVADTIPDAAKITYAAIYIPYRQIQGANPNIRLHTSPTRPGGNVAFTGATYAVAAQQGWNPIPLSFIDYLKTTPAGIGFNNGGYNIAAGTQADAQSGALDIAWEA